MQADNRAGRQVVLQADSRVGRRSCRPCRRQAVLQAGSFAGSGVAGSASGSLAGRQPYGWYRRQADRHTVLQAGSLAGRQTGTQCCRQAALEAGSLAGGVTGSASGRQSCRQTSLHATGIDAFSELLNRKESEVENMRLKKM